MTKEIDASQGKSLPSKPRKPPALEMRSVDNEALEIDLVGETGRLKSAVSNTDVFMGLVKQIAALGSHGKRLDEGAANFALGFVDSMQPKDAAEAALMAQMAATHQATMMMARRLNHVDNIQQQDSAERALNKLTRSYAAQMDTLKRYRSKGQQTVRVERVTVQDGGQAIVGTVERGRGDKNEN